MAVQDGSKALDDLITAQALPGLVQGGVLPGNLYVKALLFFRNAQGWHSWALRALLALGAGHFLAGIIFFFAYNWNDLSDFVKFAMVQGGMVVSAITWIWLKFDRPVAQVFGICLTVLIGVFMAVYGQVFQTPAALYTPFTLWALLSFPFAVVSRSLAHLTVWLVVACVAILSYAHVQIVPIAGREALVWVYGGMALAFLVLLIVYDRVQNKWPGWARAAWFRLALVSACMVFAVTAIGAGFWQEKIIGSALAAIVIGGGAFAYLYRYKQKNFANPPLARVPGLVIALSGLALMVAQIGVRLIAEADKFLGIVAMLFVGFLLMAGLTYVLARSFKHFIVQFSDEQQSETVAEIENADRAAENLDIVSRRSLGTFASATGLAPEKIAHVLAGPGEDDAPWYMEMFLGFAGVLTALLAMGFLASVLYELLNIKDETSMIFLGVLVYAGTLFMRLRNTGLFARHFFNTLILGGGALAVMGAGLVTNGGVGFIVFTGLLSALTLWLVRDRILEFVMAAGLAGLMVYVLIEYHIPFAFSVFYIFFSFVGVLTLSQPIKTGFVKWQDRRILTAASTAFLLAPCVFAVFFSDANWTAQLNLGIGNEMAERIASVLVTGGAVWTLNRLRGGTDPVRPPLPILVLLLVAVALMPLGSAAALLVLRTGYILGLRSLAIIGVLVQIGFITWFYYDMQISLLNKSFLLMGFGAALLLVYGLASKGGRHV